MIIKILKSCKTLNNLCNTNPKILLRPNVNLEFSTLIISPELQIVSGVSAELAAI